MQGGYWISLFISIAVAIITYVLSRVFTYVSPPLDVFFAIFLFFFVLLATWFQLLRSELQPLRSEVREAVNRLSSDLSKLTDMTKRVVEVLKTVQYKLLQLPRGKNLVVDDLWSIIAEVGMLIDHKLIEMAFTSSHSDNEKERRKRELLEKARRGELRNRGEAEELRKLLEEQKKEREEAGDVLGAIAINLLIMSVLGIIAYMLTKGEERSA